MRINDPRPARLLLAAGAALLSALPAARGEPPAPRPLLDLRGHARSVYHVTFSPDGMYLATCSKDHTVKLWDAATGKERRTLTGHTQDVYSSAFSPDGKLLASASEDKTIRLWDVAGGREVRKLEGHNGDVYGLAFSPDGKTLASAGEDQTARLWDVSTGKLRHTLAGHSHRVYTVAFSPDGERLVSACGTGNATGTPDAGGEVKVWDVASGKEAYDLPRRGLGVIAIAYSPDGHRLAGACLRGAVKVWEAATGQEALDLTGHTLQVYNVAFSPDGRRLASCSGKWSEDAAGEVKVWDLATGRELVSFRPHDMPIWSVAFSPDGRRLATCSGKMNKNDPGEARVWDLTALIKDRPPPAPAPGKKELEALWADLGGADAGRAYRAVWALRAAGRQAVPFLAARVRAPAPLVTPQRIAKLVAALDDNSFQAREKATAELEGLGAAARPALNNALAQGPPLEVRRRVERLLQKMKEKGVGPPPLSAEELRALRAIEVLQFIGTPDVVGVLKKLAGGPPGSAVARDAAAVLRRLPRETSSRP